jgi:rhodanese-related sulfurtransferase
MKTKILSLFICSAYCITANAQLGQRFDNTNYKAIYFKEACQLMANNPNLILLDVRSPGEYADSSKYLTSDIGRLKGAINISIDSVDKHFNDLKAYKNKTILVYCSHSQRSRLVSKFLADSGFTSVYSLNGGMTAVHEAPDADFPCKASLFTTAMPYKLMGPDDAVAFIRDKNNVVLDVRPASQFNGTDTAEFGNVGRIKNAVNIPLSILDAAMAGLAKYKDRPVLVYELNSNNAMQAALQLKKAGFKNVNVLFGGLDAFLGNIASSSGIRSELTAGAPAYKIIGVNETVGLVTNSPNLVVADMRAKTDFENKSKDNYYNLGHIKGAVNFTPASLDEYLKDKPKNTPVLIYASFNSANSRMSGMHPEPSVSTVSKHLADKGYSNVYLLYDGIYSVVWASANVEGSTNAVNILTDHAGLY